jgi:hypothetical protein
MTTEHTISSTALIVLPQTLPSLITNAGERTAWRFAEFFTATIRDPNTREAYLRAVTRFFCWCKGKELCDLPQGQRAPAQARSAR